MSVHWRNALFLNQKKILSSFPHKHASSPSSTPTLNIPSLGHSLGTFRRWSDKQQNKGSESESVRERHLIEARKGCFLGVFFAKGTLYSSCVSFFALLNISVGAKHPRQREKITSRWFLFSPSFHFSFHPFQLSPQQLCRRSTAFWFSAHWLLLKHQQPKKSTVLIPVEISFQLPSYD